MKNLLLCVVGLVSLLCSNGCTTEMGEVKSAPTTGTAQNAAPAAMDPIEARVVKFDQPLHFTGPGGSDIVVPSGSYHVQSGEVSQITLVTKDQAAPFVLAAAAITHDEQIEVPVARLISGDEDSQRLLLLSPGGDGLSAVGSEGGLRTRGITDKLGALRQTEASSVLKQLRAPTGGWVNPGGRFIPSDALPLGKKYGYGNPFSVLYACRGKLPLWPHSTFAGSIFFPAGSCFTASGKINSFEVLSPVWQYASNGTIPSGAYPTGGTLYSTCRAFYDGGKIPGKVGSGLKGCSIGYKGKEIVVPGYEVLMLSFVSSNLSQTVTATPDTYARAVFGGSSSYVDHLCAASYQGAPHPGRFNLNQNACVIGWNGQEVLVPQFSIVEAIFRAMPPDSNTLVGGKDEHGSRLPVCRFVHANGETEIGFLNAEMGTNNDPGPCDFMDSNGNFGREPFKSTQGLWDMYQNWTPGWDPVVKP